MMRFRITIVWRSAQRVMRKPRTFTVTAEADTEQAAKLDVATLCGRPPVMRVLALRAEVLP